MNKVYLAPTKKEWNRIVGQALEDGGEWADGSKELYTKYWNEYKKESVIFLKKDKTINYASKPFTEKKFKNNPNYDLTWITKVDETQEMIDKLKAKGYRVEKDEFPKMDDEYWYTDSDSICSTIWDNNYIDNERKNGLGIYRTEELANEAFNKMKEIAKEIMKKN